MSNTNTPDPISVEQLREIRSSITWGDSRKATKLAEGDDGAMTAHAFHLAGVRMGLAAADFDAFLDQVKMEDLQAALEDAEGPTKGGKS